MGEMIKRQKVLRDTNDEKLWRVMIALRATIPRRRRIWNQVRVFPLPKLSCFLCFFLTRKSHAFHQPESLLKIWIIYEELPYAFNNCRDKTEFLSIYNNSHSKSNATYFIILTHNNKWRLVWQQRLNLPASNPFFWLSYRWQLRGSLIKWYLTWKYIWNRNVSLHWSMQK